MLHDIQSRQAGTKQPRQNTPAGDRTPGPFSYRAGVKKPPHMLRTNANQQRVHNSEREMIQTVIREFERHG